MRKVTSQESLFRHNKDNPKKSNFECEFINTTPLTSRGKNSAFTDGLLSNAAYNNIWLDNSLGQASKAKFIEQIRANTAA